MVQNGDCERLRSGDLGRGWTMVKFMGLMVVVGGRALESGA